MDTLDCVVVGAGVVGLAAGRALAKAGRELVVLEAEAQIGMHASSRNSEVIHAGIYYPEGSLKARFCVQGKQMLYEYCRDKRIAHRRIGKLIVATAEADVAKLRALQAQAARNGVDDLKELSADEVRALEPQVECVAGLLSPSTGIIDSHTYMLALQADIEAFGGTVITNSRVSDLRVVDGGFEIGVSGERYRCRSLVNAAGLWAGEVAESLSVSGLQPILSRQDAAPTGSKSRQNVDATPAVSTVGARPGARPSAAPPIRYAKGHYFAYQGKSPFNHLVYPLPSGGGLGIHATNDLAGAARFGPDVEWINVIDYTFSEIRKPAFVEAIRRYFPALDAGRLVPGYTGIRAKLHGPGEGAADFLIEGPENHGVRELVNLLGIESPGLTASLAIGEYVTGILPARD